uniref:Uncharacterized protein n=1 Tax=Steinernema glaseri TaxID=37863 RepID=A0A1I7Y4U1_9BILA
MVLNGRPCSYSKEKLTQCDDRESLISYFVCCDEDPDYERRLEHTLVTGAHDRCCRKIKFWFFPLTIASIGFSLGAVFAMCFQCR